MVRQSGRCARIGSSAKPNQGKMARTRAGKPDPFFGLGHVTMAIAPTGALSIGPAVSAHDAAEGNVVQVILVHCLSSRSRQEVTPNCQERS
jgi:hypothetical protein